MGGKEKEIGSLGRIIKNLYLLLIPSLKSKANECGILMPGGAFQMMVSCIIVQNLVKYTFNIIVKFNVKFGLLTWPMLLL